MGALQLPGLLPARIDNRTAGLLGFSSLIPAPQSTARSRCSGRQGEREVTGRRCRMPGCAPGFSMKTRRRAALTVGKRFA
jgi:hypothetical protein